METATYSFLLATENTIWSRAGHCKDVINDIDYEPQHMTMQLHLIEHMQSFWKCAPASTNGQALLEGAFLLPLATSLARNTGCLPKNGGIC